MARAVLVGSLAALAMGIVSFLGCGGQIALPPVDVQLANTMGLEPDESLVGQIPGHVQGYVYVPTIARRQTGQGPFGIIGGPNPPTGYTVAIGAVVTVGGNNYEVDGNGFFYAYLDPGYTGTTVTVSVDFSGVDGFEHVTLDPDTATLLVDNTGVFAEMPVNLNTSSGYSNMIQQFSSMASIRGAAISATANNSNTGSVAFAMFISNTAGLTLPQVINAALQGSTNPKVDLLCFASVPAGVSQLNRLPIYSLAAVRQELDPNSDRRFSLYGIAQPGGATLQLTNIVLTVSASVGLGS